MVARRSLQVLLALVVVCAAQIVAPAVALAVADGSNPQTTGCANSAVTWHTYTNSANKIDIDIRYSTACKTVWARVWNRGSANITVQERVEVFNCPSTGCVRVGGYAQDEDPLVPGQSGYGMQHLLPAVTRTAAGNPVPIGVRVSAVRTSPSSALVESPIAIPWDQARSTAANTACNPCYAWPKTSANMSVYVGVVLESTLASSWAGGLVDLRPYIQGPSFNAYTAWNNLKARNPILCRPADTACFKGQATGTYTINIALRYVARTDGDGTCEIQQAELNPLPGCVWSRNNGSDGKLRHCEIALDPNVKWNANGAYGWASPGVWTADIRYTVSHEIGHCEGLGDTDMSPGAIMTFSQIPVATPQAADELGMQAIYGVYP